MQTSQIVLWDSSFDDFLPPPRKPQYPNPFLDISSVVMPTTMQEALRWGEFIVSLNGPYREALKRIIAYCITDPEVIEGDDDIVVVDKETRNKYADAFSHKCLGIRAQTNDIDLDLLTYGNAFVSVQAKFDRYLTCPGEKDGHTCGFQVPLEAVLDNEDDYEFSFSDYEFHAKCPVCGYKGVWEPKDRYSKDIHDVYIKRWNVHDLELLYDPFSGEETVIWRIPEDYKSLLNQGLPFILRNAPLEVIEAVRDNCNISFDKDFILHLKEPTLSGIRSRGWGIPRVVANFRQAILYQVFQRHNETIALESLAPFRVISPPPGGGEGKDPIMNGNLNKFVGHIGQMIRQRRQDPSSWFVSPYPLNYQTFGGDAAQFLPREQLAECLDTLLTSVGIPVDMYKGSMTVQSAPIALRLFESFWSNLVDANNKLLEFIVKRLNVLLGWEPVTAKFVSITHADDMNRQMQKLQLAQMGQISQTTALESIGLNKHEEVRRMMEEQRDEAEQQQRQQEMLETTKQLGDIFGGGALNAYNQMQQQRQGAMGGGMPPMGGPPGGPPPQGGGPGGPPPMAPGMSQFMPGNDPISIMIAQAGSQPTDTPDDMLAKAQTLANQLMMAGDTNRGLRRLKQQDPQLHAIVKDQIEQMRRNMRSEGGRQMQAQMQQGMM